MVEPVYRAAAPDTVRTVELDAFTALYHRASGITHLVTSPAPEILAMLSGEGLTRVALLERLADTYAVPDSDEAALAARLYELVAAGLVRVA